MDAGQTPGGEWWLLGLLALAAAAGRAIDYPLQWFLCLIGWRKAKEREREQASNDLLDRKVTDAVEKAMSPVRQHIASVQKGVDGKQTLLEARLNEIGEEMRARDDKLSSSLHHRMTADFSEHRKQLVQHMDRSIDSLRQHMTDLVRMALNGRNPRD